MPHFSFLMGGIFVPFPSLEALHARKPWDQRYSPPIKKESFPFYAYSRPLSCLLASPFPSRKGKEEAKGEDKIDERPISVTGKACLPDTDNKNKRAMKRIPRWLIRLSYYLCLVGQTHPLSLFHCKDKGSILSIDLLGDWLSWFSFPVIKRTKPISQQILKMGLIGRYRDSLNAHYLFYSGKQY